MAATDKACTITRVAITKKGRAGIFWNTDFAFTGGSVKPSVGLIGLGLMGRPIAANLLKKGFSLTVWNRTASRAQDLVSQGARLVATPHEAAAASDVLIMIVSDPPAVEQVLWGEKGAFSGLRRGSVLVDSSTVSPELARRSAAACAERGIEYLDEIGRASCRERGKSWGGG